ncbi:MULTISPECIES: hypothetical protein [unclassified Mesorhizobium]|uniref:hypothetical protein n=1 Tax=unclassified Mesorhizobium TaxID=325217 RepID=UPI003014632E
MSNVARYAETGRLHLPTREAALGSRIGVTDERLIGGFRQEKAGIQALAIAKVTHAGVSAEFFDPPTMPSLSEAKASWMHCVGTVAARILPALQQFCLEQFQEKYETVFVRNFVKTNT